MNIISDIQEQKEFSVLRAQEATKIEIIVQDKKRELRSFLEKIDLDILSTLNKIEKNILPDLISNKDFNSLKEYGKSRISLLKKWADDFEFLFKTVEKKTSEAGIEAAFILENQQVAVDQFRTIKGLLVFLAECESLCDRIISLEEKIKSYSSHLSEDRKRLELIQKDFEKIQGRSIDDPEASWTDQKIISKAQSLRDSMKNTTIKIAEKEETLNRTKKDLLDLIRKFIECCRQGIQLPFEANEVNSLYLKTENNFKQILSGEILSLENNKEVNPKMTNVRSGRKWPYIILGLSLSTIFIFYLAVFYPKQSDRYSKKVGEINLNGNYGLREISIEIEDLLQYPELANFLKDEYKALLKDKDKSKYKDFFKAQSFVILPESIASELNTLIGSELPFRMRAQKENNRVSIVQSVLRRIRTRFDSSVKIGISIEAGKALGGLVQGASAYDSKLLIDTQLLCGGGNGRIILSYGLKGRGNLEIPSAPFDLSSAVPYFLKSGLCPKEL